MGYFNTDLPRKEFSVYSGAMDLSDTANTLLESDIFTNRIVVKFWNGTNWVSCSLRIYNGSAWVNAHMKRYSGSTWE